MVVSTIPVRGGVRHIQRGVIDEGTEFSDYSYKVGVKTKGNEKTYAGAKYFDLDAYVEGLSEYPSIKIPLTGIKNINKATFSIKDLYGSTLVTGNPTTTKIGTNSKYDAHSYFVQSYNYDRGVIIPLNNDIALAALPVPSYRFYVTMNDGFLIIQTIFSKFSFNISNIISNYMNSTGSASGKIYIFGGSYDAKGDNYTNFVVEPDVWLSYKVSGLKTDHPISYEVIETY